MYKKIKIYLLGTIHTSAKTKKNILKHFKKLKPDAIFSEGVRHSKKINLELFIKEPILIPIILLWSKIQKLKGSEFQLLKDISKINKIPLHNIDINLKKLIIHFHRNLNYLKLFIIFIFWNYLLSK